MLPGTGPDTPTGVVTVPGPGCCAFVHPARNAVMIRIHAQRIRKNDLFICFHRLPSLSGTHEISCDDDKRPAKKSPVSVIRRNDSPPARITGPMTSQSLSSTKRLNTSHGSRSSLVKARPGISSERVRPRHLFQNSCGEEQINLLFYFHSAELYPDIKTQIN